MFSHISRALTSAKASAFNFERRINKLSFNFVSFAHRSRVSLLDHRDILAFCNSDFSGRDTNDLGRISRRYFSLPRFHQLYRLLFYNDGRSAKLAYASSFIRFRILRRRYLADSFPEPMAMELYGANYAYLLSRLSPSLFERLLNDRITLFEKRKPPKLYSIILSISSERQHEGALSLDFMADGRSLYIVSFSVVAGRLVGLQDDFVILVSRMQGRKRKLLHARKATKDLDDISPQAMLFAALRGVGQALAITHIAGVTGTNHVAFRDERSESFSSAYDRFFASVGARKMNDQFFVLDLLEPEKPINAVKPGHRLRTKLKRRVKGEIGTAAATVFASANRPDASETVELPADYWRRPA